jgi:hypothetical protein
VGGECRSSLSENDRGQAITGKEIFFMGIIDYLQYYNRKKAAENFFKGFRYDRTWAQPPPPTVQEAMKCVTACPTGLSMGLIFCHGGYLQRDFGCSASRLRCSLPQVP